MRVSPFCRKHSIDQRGSDREGARPIDPQSKHPEFRNCLCGEIARYQHHAEEFRQLENCIFERDNGGRGIQCDRFCTATDVRGRQRADVNRRICAAQYGGGWGEDRFESNASNGTVYVPVNGTGVTAAAVPMALAKGLGTSAASESSSGHNTSVSSSSVPASTSVTSWGRTRVRPRGRARWRSMRPRQRR